MTGKVKIFILIGVALFACGQSYAFLPDTVETSGKVRPPIIFAASSLVDILNDAAKNWSKATGRTAPTVSLGPSAILARQIIRGAPAALFISAHPHWTDFVLNRKSVRREPISLAKNSLVFIPPAQIGDVAGKWDKAYISGVMKNNRVVIADPDTAPAGKYALQALTSLLGKEPDQSAFILAPDAARALTLVRRGGQAGILYRSAIQNIQLNGIVPVPRDAHDDIIYSAVLLENNPDAARFLSWLQSDAALDLWQKHGFQQY